METMMHTLIPVWLVALAAGFPQEQKAAGAIAPGATLEKVWG